MLEDPLQICAASFHGLGDGMNELQVKQSSLYFKPQTKRAFSDPTIMHYQFLDDVLPMMGS